MIERSTTRYREAPDRNLALELVRVTEAAAMAAGRWVGRGDKNGGDGAAVDAMRQLINSVPMRGVVVIGEGEKDDAPMLFNGEQVGDGSGPEVRRRGRPDRRHHADEQGHAERAGGARRRRAAARCSTRRAVFYMEKLAVGPESADVIDIDAGVRRTCAGSPRRSESGDLRRHRLHPGPAAARAT